MSTGAATQKAKRPKPVAQQRRHHPPTVAPGDHEPRQRFSATWNERKEIEESLVSVVNPIPPLAPTTFASWEEFDQAFSEYQEKHHVRYSKRSSRGTAHYNRCNCGSSSGC